jgi:lysophospholipase L1-like esterase
MPGVRLSAAVAAALVILASNIAPAGAQAVAPANCDVPQTLLFDESPLNHVARALRRDRALKIVVLGSASSLGSGATNPDAAWPKRLEVHLAAKLPEATVQVVNRSIAGQGAEKMVDRLRSEVVPEKPSLVIWQTGTAEAVRAVELDQFMSTLVAGVDQLIAGRADVMLMDPQYSRLTARLINFQPYVDALNQVAGMRDLVVIPRYSIMRYWIDSGRFNLADLPRSQVAQVADQVYDCIGRIVAKVILSKLK